jgi:hypothetical protein
MGEIDPKEVPNVWKNVPQPPKLRSFPSFKFYSRLFFLKLNFLALYIFFQWDEWCLFFVAILSFAVRIHRLYTLNCEYREFKNGETRMKVEYENRLRKYCEDNGIELTTDIQTPILSNDMFIPKVHPIFIISYTDRITGKEWSKSQLTLLK